MSEKLNEIRKLSYWAPPPRQLFCFFHNYRKVNIFPKYFKKMNTYYDPSEFYANSALFNRFPAKKHEHTARFLRNKFEMKFIPEICYNISIKSSLTIKYKQNSFTVHKKPLDSISILTYNKVGILFSHQKYSKIRRIRRIT